MEATSQDSQLVRIDVDGTVAYIDATTTGNGGAGDDVQRVVEAGVGARGYTSAIEDASKLVASATKSLSEHCRAAVPEGKSGSIEVEL